MKLRVIAPVVAAAVLWAGCAGEVERHRVVRVVPNAPQGKEGQAAPVKVPAPVPPGSRPPRVVKVDEPRPPQGGAVSRLVVGPPRPAVATSPRPAAAVSPASPPPEAPSSSPKVTVIPRPSTASPAPAPSPAAPSPASPPPGDKTASRSAVDPMGPPRPAGVPAARQVSPAAPAPAVRQAPAGSPVTLQERMRDLEQKLTMREQEKNTLAEAYYQMGRTYYERHELTQAQSVLEQAVTLRPGHELARQLAHEVGQLLGNRESEVADTFVKAMQEERVKWQEAEAEIDRRVEAGRRQLAAGNARQAGVSFTGALEIMRWMPLSAAAVEGKRRQTEALLDQARKQEREEGDRIRLEQQEAARRLARAAEEEHSENLSQRIKAMFAAANRHFEKEQYELAELLADKILELDGENVQAKQLAELSRNARHAKEDRQSTATYMEEWKKTFEALDESAIFQNQVLVWPSREDWEMIEQRKPKGISQARNTVDPETQKVLNRIAILPPLGMDMPGSPLTNAVEYLRKETGLNINIDPAVFVEKQPEDLLINTPKLTNVDFLTALELVTEITGLAYKIEEGIITILPRNRQVDKIRMELYDVRDLTAGLKNFPGPRLEINMAGGEELKGAKVAMGTGSEEPGILGEEVLKNLVQDTIAKGTWDNEPYAISVQNGTLIIRHTDKVHTQVSRLLEDLRKATGLLVTVESRFIRVSDDFLEDIGTDFHGLGKDLDDVEIADANYKAGTDAKSGYYDKSGNNGDLRARVEHLLDGNLGGGIGVAKTGGAAVSYTFLDNVQLEAILRAVRKAERLNQVTAPKLTLFNTQRANITVITQRAYIKDYEVQVAEHSVVAKPVIGNIQNGVVLDVRPIISSDRRFITLELRPVVADQPNMRTNEQLSLGAGVNVQVDLPQMNIRRLFTTVTIPDRGTVMIGGLNKLLEEDRTTEVPWLSDIPLLGALFSEKGKSKIRESLIILVKASITSLEEEVPTY